MSWRLPSSHGRLIASVEHPGRPPRSPPVAELLRRRGGHRRAAKRVTELPAGGNSKLRKHLAEVVLGSARADEKLSPDLRVGVPIGRQARNQRLLAVDPTARSCQHLPRPAGPALDSGPPARSPSSDRAIGTRSGGRAALFHDADWTYPSPRLMEGAHAVEEEYMGCCSVFSGRLPTCAISWSHRSRSSP